MALTEVSKGQRIRADGYNELIRAAKMVFGASGTGGVNVSGAGGALSIGFSGPMRYSGSGDVFPASTNGNDEFGLGNLAVVKLATFDQEKYKSVDKGVQAVNLEIEKFSTANETSSTFCVCAGPIRKAAQGEDIAKHGYVYLSGIVWVRGKREADGDDTFFSAEPVDGETYLKFTEGGGLFDLIAEEDVENKAEEHWGIMRLNSIGGNPRLYKVTTAPSGGKCKAKSVTVGGTVVGAEVEFFVVE